MDIDKTQNDNLQALMKIEWDNYRYMDGLRWSRMQNVLVVEAALLTGAYSKYFDIDATRRLCFVVLMTTVALLICMIAEKDGRDARKRRARAVDLEISLDLPKFRIATSVFGMTRSKTFLGVLGLMFLLDFGVAVDLLHTIFQNKPAY